MLSGLQTHRKVGDRRARWVHVSSEAKWTLTAYAGSHVWAERKTSVREVVSGSVGIPWGHWSTTERLSSSGVCSVLSYGRPFITSIPHAPDLSSLTRCALWSQHIPAREHRRPTLHLYKPFSASHPVLCISWPGGVDPEGCPPPSVACSWAAMPRVGVGRAGAESKVQLWELGVQKRGAKERTREPENQAEPDRSGLKFLHRKPPDSSRREQHPCLGHQPCQASFPL